MSKNGLNPKFSKLVSIIHPFCPYLYLGGDLFWGTATFRDQIALLRYVDREEVREVESEILFSPFCRKLFNVQQY